EKPLRLDETLERLVPFRIARIEIVDGAGHFKNIEAKPPVDLKMTGFDAVITNVTNLKKQPFATCEANAKVMESGKFELKAQINPQTENPTFDVRAKLTRLYLTTLNPFFKHYAFLDFSKGRGDVVAEITSKNGKLDG